MFKACLDNFIYFYFKIKCWGIFLKGLKYGLVVEHLFNVYKILVLILNIIKKKSTNCLVCTSLSMEKINRIIKLSNIKIFHAE